MKEDTRKLLKIFGVKVTDFEEKSRELLKKAEEAKARGDLKGLFPLCEDLIGLAADLNRWWLEVTQRIFEVRHATYTGMARILEEAKKLEGGEEAR